MTINTKINQNAAPTLDLLKRRFPDIFVDDETRMRPLKIGIHKDLFDAFEGQVTRMSIRGALALYTSSPGYKPVIQPGVPRIGLNGETCGVVEEEYKDRLPKSRKSTSSRPARDSDAPQKRRGTVQHPARRVRARKQQENAAVGQSTPSSTSSTPSIRPSRQGHPSRAGTRPPVVIRTAVKVPGSQSGAATPSLLDELKNTAVNNNRPIIKLKKRRKIASDSPEEGNESNESNES